MTAYEIPGRTCTARWATGNAGHDAGDLCGAPAAEEIGDSELCAHHYRRAMDWFYRRRIELPLKHQREHEESLRRAAEAADGAGAGAYGVSGHRVPPVRPARARRQRRAAAATR